MCIPNRHTGSSVFSEHDESILSLFPHSDHDVDSLLHSMKDATGANISATSGIVGTNLGQSSTKTNNQAVSWVAAREAIFRFHGARQGQANLSSSQIDSGSHPAAESSQSGSLEVAAQFLNESAGSGFSSKVGITRLHSGAFDADGELEYGLNCRNSGKPRPETLLNPVFLSTRKSFFKDFLQKLSNFIDNVSAKTSVRPDTITSGSLEEATSLSMALNTPGLTAAKAAQMYKKFQKNESLENNLKIFFL